MPFELPTAKALRLAEEAITVARRTEEYVKRMSDDIHYLREQTEKALKVDGPQV